MDGPRVSNPKPKLPDEKLTIFEILDLVNEPFIGELNEHDKILHQVFDDILSDPEVVQAFNAGNTYQVLMNLVSEKMSEKLADQIGKYYNFMSLLEKDQSLKMTLIERFVDAIAQNSQKVQEFPYNEALLKQRLQEMLSERFEELKNWLRPLEETIDTFFLLLHCSSVPSLDGINELIRTTINRWALDANIRPVDRQMTYNVLSGKFETYLKKIYYLLHGEMVKKSDGSNDAPTFVDIAKTFSCLRGLRKNNSPAYQRMKEWYGNVYEWRNAEAHTSPTLNDNELKERIQVLLTVYLFVTANSITELETEGVLDTIQNSGHIQMPLDNYSLAAEGDSE